MSKSCSDDPMTRCTPTEEEILAICDEYGIGHLQSIDGDLGGLFNVNLKITTSAGAYVVRIHSGLSRQNHLESELSVTDKLRANGVRALAPLLTPTTNKSFLQLHNRFVQVTHFVEATSFQALPEQSFECGRMLRKIHDVLSDTTDVPTPYWSNYPSSELVEEGLLLLRNQPGHDRAMIEKAEELYVLINRLLLPYQDELRTSIVHGDWHPWNVLFDHDGQAVAVLDFDFAQRGQTIHDIAYYLWAIRNTNDCTMLGRSFMNGYGEITPVESTLMPAAIARASAFFVWTASFVADPVTELKHQFETQLPYIEWLLSGEGSAEIQRLFD